MCSQRHQLNQKKARYSARLNLRILSASLHDLKLSVVGSLLGSIILRSKPTFLALQAIDQFRMQKIKPQAMEPIEPSK